jgi:hypothetical protein
MVTKIFTDEVLDSIPAKIEAGLCRKQIAQDIGVSVESLQVTCCRHGISLRRKGWVAKVRKSRNKHQRLLIAAELIARLRERAERHGVTECHLVTRLLELIVEDDLFDAILDDTVEVKGIEHAAA